MNRESNLLSGSDIVQCHKKCSKELPEIGSKLFEPSGSWFEEGRLESNIEERYSLLKEPRIERDSLLSIAQWDPEKRKVVVLKKRGKEWETYGHHDHKTNLDYLNPEEALFLIESNSLLLMYDNVEVSLEIGYALLLSSESDCSLDQYRVFSHLSRLGYKLIRHKRPNQNSVTVEIPKSQPLLAENKLKDISGSSTSNDGVVVIDDSSSESSNDDVVILDEETFSNDDVIDILDDDSRDSDLVMLEGPNTVELPLANWPYVHRKLFLRSNNVSDGTSNRHTFVDSCIISLSDHEIFNEIPNIKSNRMWLYRPNEMLLPDGVWPFHFQYRIDLNIEKNENFRGRGRGRGWYLQRQVNQMKNYTISLMNMVSQLMGGQGMDVIPPPPGLFQGSNRRHHRGYNFQGRGRNQSWGCIPLNYSHRTSNYSNSIISETVELSDDEEGYSHKRIIKRENGNNKSKKIKLESDAISIGSSGSIKLESLDPGELDIKTETNSDLKPDITSLLTNICVKNENVKTEIKTEEGSAVNDSGEHIQNPVCEDSGISTIFKENSKNVSTSPNSELSNILSESHSSQLTTSAKESCNEGGSFCGEQNNCEEVIDGAKVCNDVQEENVSIETTSDHNHTDSRTNEVTDDQVGEGFCLESTLPKCHLLGESKKEVESESRKNQDCPDESCVSSNVDMEESSVISLTGQTSTNSGDSGINLETRADSKRDFDEKSNVVVDNKSIYAEHHKPNDLLNSADNSIKEMKETINNDSENVSICEKTSKSQILISSDNTVYSDTTVAEDINCDLSSAVQSINKSIIIEQTKPNVNLNQNSNPQSNSTCVRNIEVMDTNEDISQESNEKKSDTPSKLDQNEEDAAGLSSDCKKTSTWKQLKETDKKNMSNSQNKSDDQDEALSNVSDMDEEQVDIGTPLVQTEHCTSLDSVLKRLQIFGQYTSKKEDCEDINVVYDVYLPTSSYYRHLSPDPDFRLVMLRLEDHFPGSEQMINLRRIYNDNKNFLFAVVLKESIAYYLYDNVFLPVDNTVS